MDDDLKLLFAAQRESERDASPPWSLPTLHAPCSEARGLGIVISGTVGAALAIAASFYFFQPATPRMTDLPPLIVSVPDQLFTTLDAPSSDQFLPPHLTIGMP